MCGLSGGVDSSVAAALVHRAIGERLTCIFVDNGLLREGERGEVEREFREHLGMRLVAVDASRRFLDALAGVTDPEQKRRIIGRVFIEVFEEEAARLGERRLPGAGHALPRRDRERLGARALGDDQDATTTWAACPSAMKLALVEPLRELFKDEVREVGRQLGLPETIVGRHPFPGPGLAVRVLGEVTAERLATLRRADAILIEELRRARALRRDLAGLRGAAAGPERRRDGRRAHLRERRSRCAACPPRTP